ncbi:hypothetical protein CKA32_005913 [Geitlerinema sp. FC II]|nr:hypothetical protein CKA32_005913 [Geitlerinema sp. FC II]
MIRSRSFIHNRNKIKYSKHKITSNLCFLIYDETLSDRDFLQFNIIKLYQKIQKNYILNLKRNTALVYLKLKNKIDKI